MQANRYAKLKQCKLDARREQWLSQGICVWICRMGFLIPFCWGFGLMEGFGDGKREGWGAEGIYLGVFGCLRFWVKGRFLDLGKKIKKKCFYFLFFMFLIFDFFLKLDAICVFRFY